MKFPAVFKFIKFNSKNITVKFPMAKSKSSKSKSIGSLDLVFFKLLRKISIQSRLRISFILLLLLAVTVIGGAAVYKSSVDMKDKISITSVELNKQVATNMDYLFAKYNQTMNELLSSSDVQDVTTNSADSAQKINSSFKITTQIMNKVNTETNLNSIDIQLNSGENYGVVVLTKPQEDAIKKSVDDAQNIVWSLNISSGSHYITGADRIRNSVLGILNDTKGYIFVNINSEKFYSLFKDINFGNGSEMYVIDSNGAIVAGSNSSKIGTKLPYNGLTDKVVSQSKNTPSKNYFDFIASKGTSLVTYNKLAGTNWYFISIIPYTYINSATFGLIFTTLIVAIITLILSIFISLMISKSISYPLNNLVTIINRAKHGDLTVEADDDSNDEISKLVSNFNDMIKKINSLLQNVKNLSESVTDSTGKIAEISENSYTSSEEIASTILQIAAGASNQAVNSSNSLNYMSTLADGINIVGNDMNGVSAEIKKAEALKEDAGNSIKALNDKAVKTSSATDKIAQEVNELNSSMAEIKNIVKLIVAVAEQTNLLSLNAAIEAARAGEAGRGFAVVADEVRKLADQSKDASIKINTILNEIQNKTQRTANEANNTKNIIKEQMDAVSDTDNAFKVVFKSMEDISLQMKHMESSVKDMQAAKESTLSSIEGISAVSEETAATTEEVSASTQEQIAGAERLSTLTTDLNSMSSELIKAISYFKVK